MQKVCLIYKTYNSNQHYLQVLEHKQVKKAKKDLNLKC